MGTSPKAKRPAKKDATSSAEYLHQVRVDDISVSIFSDGRYTIQRRYFDPDRKVGYASSFRSKDLPAISEALKEADEWYAENAETERSGDAE